MDREARHPQEVRVWGQGSVLLCRAPRNLLQNFHDDPGPGGIRKKTTSHFDGVGAEGRNRYDARIAGSPVHRWTKNQLVDTEGENQNHTKPIKLKVFLHSTKNYSCNMIKFSLEKK